MSDRAEAMVQIELERPQHLVAGVSSDDDSTCCRTAVEAHRSRVLVRLLDGGVSPGTLSILLPEWTDLIGAIADGGSAAAR